MSEGSLIRLARSTLLVPFPGADPPRWLLDELERGLGGVILFAINGNVPDNERLAALTARLRGTGDAIVSIDEEGGDVTRLAHLTGSPYPGNAALGVVDDAGLTRRVYRSLGTELIEVGVNLDLAPTVDVNCADDNPIIGVRSFGSDPELVARHAAAAVAGLQDAGVAACAKHFPGHGATVTDSHLGLPTVHADLDLLERRELVPFRAAISAGTKAIMTAHINLPGLTGSAPATLSHAAITGLLRDRLGYRGVVVSDALDMRGASGAIGIPEAAVRALSAGADLLCLGSQEFSESVANILAAIVTAVRSGRLAEERLAEAAERIRLLRSWLAGGHPVTASAGGPRSAESELGLDAARRAVHRTGEPPPLRDPLVIELETAGSIAAGPVPWGLSPWADDVLRVDGATADAAQLLDRARERSLIVVVRDAHRHPDQRRLTLALLAARPDAVVVEMGLPVWRPPAVHLATYGATRANGKAAAEVLGLAPR